MTEKEIKIIYKIIDDTKRKVSMEANYLDKSIDFLCKNVEFTYMVSPFGTDGKTLFINANDFLNLYKGNAVLIRYFLHMVLHCFYQHYLKKNDYPYDIYNVACDIFVEYLIDNRFEDVFGCGEPYKREMIYQKLLDFGCTFSLNEILDLMIQYSVDFNISSLSKIFTYDDHRFWKEFDDMEGFNYEDDIDFGDFFDDNSQLDIEVSDKTEEKDKDKERKNKNNKIQIEKDKNNDELFWRQLFEQCSADKRRYKEKSKSTKVLDEENKRRELKVDYKLLLRDFLNVKEIQKENIDEYDLGFYSYGMKLYKNVPLIESLETSTNRELSNIVIALDTSRSIERETLVKFLRETMKIIKQNVIADKLSILIIQADEHINEVKEITSMEELDDYILEFNYSGGGATDFTVVFEKIEQLKLEEKKIIEGLIYLTDGEGIYPQIPPNYKTAFVFIEGVGETSFVPAWAEKIIISEADYD